MPSVLAAVFAGVVVGAWAAKRQLRSTLSAGRPWHTVQFTQDAPCAPDADTVSQLLGRTQSHADPEIKFYLFDSGAFNLTDTMECFFTKMNGTLGVDDVDLHVMPQWAQHMTDYWLIEQMKNHPNRTMDPEEADLFVIGAPLMTSWFAAHMDWIAADLERKCGVLEDHYARADAVAEELKSSKYWKRNGGRDFLYINTAPTGHFKHAVHDQLLPMVTQGLYATADRMYGGCANSWINYCHQATVMPYKAHYLLEEQFKKHAESDRNVSIMFHGDMGRGTGDRAIMLILAGKLPHSSLHDARFTHDHDLETFLSVSIETVHTYMNSSFCFVPAGDTPTSRRLFDSLAAGCVPVVLADFPSIADNLPFKRTIDWTQIAIFAGDMKCMSDHVEGTKAWLEDLVSKRSSPKVAEMRELGQKAFRFLSYHSPETVTAMLRELKEPLEARLAQ